MYNYMYHIRMFKSQKCNTCLPFKGSIILVHYFKLTIHVRLSRKSLTEYTIKSITFG